MHTSPSDLGGRTHHSRRVPSAPSAQPVGLPIMGSSRITREQPTHPQGGAASSTGKRSSSQRPTSDHADTTRSSSRHCQSRASAPHTTEPVKLRLDSSPGQINEITHGDAAALGGLLRRLTQEEVTIGRLNILPIKDVAYWAELNLGGHRLYIVAVLTQHADVRFSSLGVFDLLISGIETLPPGVYQTLRMSAIRLHDNREVRVRLGTLARSDGVEVPYIQVPWSTRTPGLSWMFRPPPRDGIPCYSGQRTANSEIMRRTGCAKRTSARQPRSGTSQRTPSSVASPEEVLSTGRTQSGAHK